VNDAIAGEKELKGWGSLKKEALINTKNPDWSPLNNLVCIHGPPKENIKQF
jgi:predicted GIY-YIG superfamily endonuclease